MVFLLYEPEAQPSVFAIATTGQAALCSKNNPMTKAIVRNLVYPYVRHITEFTAS
jgi:hypothetical protein